MLDVHEWEAELSESLEPFLDALGHKARQLIMWLFITSFSDCDSIKR
ncbi:hypothetical protein SAE02_71740 [Skermanella aerolata]|uniref:Uncharacterized protein n=1 Tax=Skermanella aerolata TaxID=393310 RepID=A0A512E2X2_9PROT|nr:hypothetical protein N826_34270 [Skermanella aerolata KACC 11604]GEO43026.1 hypothetical protein SAE02_71740 [Skermanella aerolata]